MWSRWDAPHYLDLVVFGYRDGDSSALIGPHGYRSIYPDDLALYIVFFPLFPWPATAVNVVVDGPLVSAFVVTTVASVFVAPLLYRLVSTSFVMSTPRYVSLAVASRRTSVLVLISAVSLAGMIYFAGLRHRCVGLLSPGEQVKGREQPVRAWSLRRQAAAAS